MNDIVANLDGLLRAGRYDELESASRELLAQRRFYLWHLYLIVSLLRTGRRDEAEHELGELFSYKFNIEDRAWPEIKAAFPEKFDQHFILSTMKAEVGLESGAPIRRRWDVPGRIDDQAQFERVVAAMLAEAVPELPRLPREDTRVTTFGSCFAANLARLLNQSGVNATNLLIEESINSPLANQAFLRALAGGDDSVEFARVETTFGAGFVARARDQIADAQVVVVTLGVAPSFFHAGTGEFAFLENYKALLAEGLVFMRTPSVEEIKAVVGDVLRNLRAINPGARIYVSISPVPLLGTAELSNTVVADCVSKTTLRAALHEVLQGEPVTNVHYWPSFEIVRWLGGHSTLAIFGADDNVSRHVSDWVVKLIVEHFSRHLFGQPAEVPVAAAATASAVATASLARGLTPFSR